MPQTHDILLNGAGYMLVPGSYQYAAQGAAVSPGRAGIRAWDAPPGEDDGTRWQATGFLPTPVGFGARRGLLLGPALQTAATSMGAATATNCHGTIYHGTVYLSLGANLYAVTTAPAGGVPNRYSGVTLIGAAAGPITSMWVYNDLLYMACDSPATTLSNYAGTGGIVGAPAVIAQAGWAYAGANWFSRRDAPAKIRATPDSGATFLDWQLDGSVRAVCVTGQAVYLGTAGSLWKIQGAFQTTTASGSTTITWNGAVTPLIQTPGLGGADDFDWLVSYRGDVYTWLAGTVQRLSLGGVASPALVPVPDAPRGTSARACVAGGNLLVCWQGADGYANISAYDGARWVTLFRANSVAPVNPVGTGGIVADGHALCFLLSTSQLGRMEFPVAALTNFPASSGVVIAGPWDAGAGDARKAWTEVEIGWNLAAGAAANPGGALTIETSADDGATWAAVGTTTIGAGATAGTIRQPIAVTSERLTVRATWTPTSVYAGWQLTGIWANGWTIAAAPHKEAWTLKLRLSDKLPRRDGSVDSRTGEQMRAALRALAQSGVASSFLDVDYDLAALARTVRVVGYAETARRGDGVHFWEAEAVVQLEAVN